jgi:hypothetical protein
MARGHDDQRKAEMTLVKTTFDKVPVGGTFYGPARKERYTKISSISSSKEEGFCKGYIFNWRGDNIFLVEEPQTPATAAHVKEQKPWHVCYLCEHGPDYGVLEACDSCKDYSKWEPRKAMLEWHKDMMVKEKLGWS